MRNVVQQATQHASQRTFFLSTLEAEFDEFRQIYFVWEEIEAKGDFVRN